MAAPIPIPITEAVTAALSRSAPSSITRFTALSGGCINHGGRLSTTTGDFFLKWNRSAHLKGMFEAEAKGLEILRATRAIHVPEVIATGDLGKYQYLLLEYMEQPSARRDYWSLLGNHLASLHRTTAPSSGLDHNNYIGSLPQSNKLIASWPDFFVLQRLAPLVQQAVDKRLAPSGWPQQFERLYQKLENMLPDEPVSLLHGDLWQGNVIVDTLGAPCLIDPAIYYGHREVDLAMTRLFGEFEPDFYHAYQETYPLVPDFERRFEIYNLYPLLVHLLLFGASYVTPIQSTLNAFA